MMTQRETLKAVHDSDLKEFLDGLGLYNKFASGKLTCAFCGDVLSLKNLHSIFPDSGTVKLSCDRASCVEELHLRLYELRSR